MPSMLDGALMERSLMFKSLSLSLVLILAAAAGPSLAADPTPHQVYETARSGHLAEAQQMINEVLRDHPQSGEAHYVAAVVNAQLGNLALARQEFAKAQQLEPGLPFASRNSVRALQRQLHGGEGSMGTQRAARPFPWGWLLLLLGGVAFLWSLLRRRAQQGVYRTFPTGTMGPNAPPGSYGGPGGPGAMPPGGVMPGTGSGMLGGLATGLAAGAGLAAGEEVIHRVMDRDRPDGAVPGAGASEPDADNSSMGGADFGVDDGSSWDEGASGGDAGDGGDDWT
jgi:hypothetical protein